MKTSYDWTSVIIGTSDGFVTIRDVRDLRGGTIFACSKGRAIDAVSKLDAYHDSFAVAVDDQLALWDRRFASTPVLYFTKTRSFPDSPDPIPKKARSSRPWFSEVERATRTTPAKLGGRIQWVGTFDHMLATGFRDGINLHCPRSGLLLASATFPLGSSCTLAPGLSSLFRSKSCPVAVGDLHGRLSIYDMRSSKYLWQEEQVRGHVGPITVMTPSFNSNIVSVGSDGIVCDRVFKLVNR